MSKVRWTATVEFWFDCPNCGLRVLEGNPRACPHQNGPRCLYNPLMDGVVENADYIMRQMGVGIAPVTTKTIPVKRKAMTTDEVVQASCSHGT